MSPTFQDMITKGARNQEIFHTPGLCVMEQGSDVLLIGRKFPYVLQAWNSLCSEEGLLCVCDVTVLSVFLQLQCLSFSHDCSAEPLQAHSLIILSGIQ